MDSKTVSPDKILALAPMAGYTDFPYRKLISQFSSVLMTSEMLSAKSILYNNKETIKCVLDVNREEKTGIQLMGSEPEILEKTIEQINSIATPYFIELNAGCPVKKVVKKGSGSALLTDLKNFTEVVQVMRKITKGLFSVKIRLGWSRGDIVAKEVVHILENEGVDWVTIHGRTRDQMYKGEADWELIGEIAETGHIPIIGNGDITSKEAVFDKFSKYNLKGIAIGRGVIGRPWIFKEIETDNFSLTNEDKLKIILKHIDAAVSYYGNPRGIIKITVHLMKYIREDRGSKDIRSILSRERDINVIKRVLTEHFIGENIKTVEVLNN